MKFVNSTIRKWNNHYGNGNDDDDVGVDSNAVTDR